MSGLMHVAFPFDVDRLGHTASVDGDRHIRNLIEQLLFTMPGERVNRPTFGTGLMQLVFEPTSREIATAVEFLVQGSLQQFLGDLITVESVTVTSEESAIEVAVEYRIRRTDDRRVERFTRSA
jgi:phage baseplate assembly protein W